jgi:hypothetical protein
MYIPALHPPVLMGTALADTVRETFEEDIRTEKQGVNVTIWVKFEAGIETVSGFALLLTRDPVHC